MTTIVRSGRVLVPGLTMGVLGPGLIFGGETGPMPVNSTYAQTLENQFRQSGIMHLMAVSGGHFVLVAGWCAGYACGCCLIGG